VIFASARGLVQSKTLRAIHVPAGIRDSVLDFRLRQTPARRGGGPPPLFPGARLWLKTQSQHVRNHEPLEILKPTSPATRCELEQLALRCKRNRIALRWICCKMGG